MFIICGPIIQEMSCYQKKKCQCIGSEASICLWNGGYCLLGLPSNQTYIPGALL